MHTLYDTMFLPAYSGSPHAHNAAQGRASFFSHAEVCLISSEKGQNASAMIHWAENLLWRFKDSAGGALDAYFRSTQEIPLFDVWKKNIKNSLIIPVIKKVFMARITLVLGSSG